MWLGGRIRTCQVCALARPLVRGVLTAKTSRNSNLVSMRLECLSGLKQRLQAGENTWPAIGAGSVSGVILGPLVMRYRYFRGFRLRQPFACCACGLIILAHCEGVLKRFW